MKRNNKVKSLKTKLEVESIGPLSPQNEVIYEMGKEMLKSSLSIARDFCKFMITSTIGAIPIYLGLFKFVLSENTILSGIKLLLSIIPLLLFFFSTILFICGYLPKASRLYLDNINDIEQAHDKIIIRRKIFIYLGTTFFFIGIIVATVSILINIIKW